MADLNYPMIKIDWYDVASFDLAGLGDVEDLEDIEPPKASIIGFLVKETDSAYFVAKEVWETGQFKYTHIVPKRTAIDKVEFLEVKDVKSNPESGK